MNKIIIALSVVLATLLGVLIYCICNDGTADKPEQRETLPVSSTAEPSEERETEPATTEKPTETEPATGATREETTELTEETTQATEETTQETTQETTPPAGEAGNSGRFSSNTGTGLELLVDWTTYTDENGTDMVRFDISIESYSIYVGSRVNGIVVTMGGQTKKLDSGEIIYTTGPKKTFLLGSCTMELPSATAQAEVSWDFFGSYKDTPMDQITASGEVRR